VIPTTGTIRAAYYCLEHVDQAVRRNEVVALVSEAVRESLPFVHGLDLSLELGWLEQEDEMVLPARVRFRSPFDMLRAHLIARPPVWFFQTSAVGDELRLPRFMPPVEDTERLEVWGVVMRSADGTFRIPLGMATLWGEALRAARAAIPDRRTEVDDLKSRVLQAERARLRVAGCDDLAGLVSHVSLLSNRYGYHVRSYAGIGGQTWNAEDELHLHVGVATPSGDNLRTFLTRYEKDVGVADRNWVLALCPLVGGPQYLSRATFLSLGMPNDGAQARWVESELTVRRQTMERNPVAALG
jgi:hypothetical protein